MEQILAFECLSVPFIMTFKDLKKKMRRPTNLTCSHRERSDHYVLYACSKRLQKNLFIPDSY